MRFDEDRYPSIAMPLYHLHCAYFARVYLVVLRKNILPTRNWSAQCQLGRSACESEMPHGYLLRGSNATVGQQHCLQPPLHVRLQIQTPKGKETQQIGENAS